MTKVQQDFFSIQKEQSENKEKLSLILLTPVEKRSAEQIAEHTTLQERIPKVEVRFQESLAALRAEQEKGVTIIDAEARELELLTGRGERGRDLRGGSRASADRWRNRRNSKALRLGEQSGSA